MSAPAPGLGIVLHESADDTIGRCDGCGHAAVYGCSTTVYDETTA
jgi:hypothetical protein